MVWKCGIDVEGSEGGMCICGGWLGEGVEFVNFVCCLGELGLLMVGLIIWWVEIKGEGKGS